MEVNNMFFVWYILAGIVAFVISINFTLSKEPEGMKKNSRLKKCEPINWWKYALGFGVILITWPVMLPRLVMDDLKDYELYRKYHGEGEPD